MATEHTRSEAILTPHFQRNRTTGGPDGLETPVGLLILPTLAAARFRDGIFLFDLDAPAERPLAP